MDALERVTLVATHEPAALVCCPEFAWTAPLGAEQRQAMHEEARQALRPDPDAEPGDTPRFLSLDADWRVAEKLMGRPEFVASVQPEWPVSDFWFYGPEWQAGEREVDEALARGEHGPIYHSTEEFFAALEAHAHLRA